MSLEIFTEDNEYVKVRHQNLKYFKDKGLTKNYNKNACITEVNKRKIFLITEGRVKISVMNEQGSEKILFILSKGDIFGEIDAFETNHNYEAVSLINTSLQVIDTYEFKEFLKEEPEIYTSVIKSIIRKYQILYSQLNDLVFKDCMGKLASTLLRMAEQEGECVGNHVEYFYLKQQDIADLLGSSRITITRLLKRLKMEDIIEISNNRIKILDKEQLLKYI